MIMGTGTATLSSTAAIAGISTFTHAAGATLAFAVTPTQAPTISANNITLGGKFTGSDGLHRGSDRDLHERFCRHDNTDDHWPQRHQSLGSTVALNADPANATKALDLTVTEVAAASPPPLRRGGDDTEPESGCECSAGAWLENALQRGLQSDRGQRSASLQLALGRGACVDGVGGLHGRDLAEHRDPRPVEPAHCPAFPCSANARSIRRPLTRPICRRARGRSRPFRRSSTSSTCSISGAKASAIGDGSRATATPHRLRAPPAASCSAAMSRPRTSSAAIGARPRRRLHE